MSGTGKKGFGPGKATTAIWAGEQTHEPYERATQVPVVHSVAARRSRGFDQRQLWRHEQAVH
jgi:hypothetical protein